MPVIDSIAPIMPNTPRDMVATRDANRAPSIPLFHVWMYTGSSLSTSRSVLLMAAASGSESRSARTTSQVSLEGHCRMGRNMASC